MGVGVAAGVGPQRHQRPPDQCRGPPVNLTSVVAHASDVGPPKLTSVILHNQTV